MRDDSGSIVGQELSPVKAVTVDELGGSFGADRHRQLVVSLCDGDVIKFHLLGCGKKRDVTILAADVYRHAIDCAARKIARAKRETRAAVVAARNLRAKLARQERQFTARIRAEDDV